MLFLWDLTVGKKNACALVDRKRFEIYWWQMTDFFLTRSNVLVNRFLHRNKLDFYSKKKYIQSLIVEICKLGNKEIWMFQNF